MDVARRSIGGLQAWRQMTPSQLLIVDDLKLSKLSVDKVTQFSLRPPELIKLFNQLGEYYRWFVVGKSKIKITDYLVLFINVRLERSFWIDCLQRQVRVRRKALPEIIAFINNIQEEEQQLDEGVRETIDFFQQIYELVVNYNDNDERLIQQDQQLRRHIFENLLYDDDDKDHLPIPVFSYITPTMTTSFLLHIMLSMGRFETEVDILMHESLRECLRYCKLIGESDDDESLKSYADNLTKQYIIEQVQYFPNSKKVIDHWIITASNLFRQVIIHDEIPLTEMPPVQLSTLLASQEENIVNHRLRLKTGLIEAAFEELGEESIRRCRIPSKENLLNATAQNPLGWDPVESFHQNALQSQDSFNEQKFAIQTVVETINSYRDFTHQTTYTKNVGIRGIPGGGKTWCMIYMLLYAIAQGNIVTTTAMMCKRAIQIGGTHVHQLFRNPIENTASAHRQAELAILSLMRKPEKLDFLRAVNMIFFDEMGQVSDVMLSILDIILKKVRNSNVYMGGVVIFISMDHTQIQPINGRPFLTSCHIIPCFKVVSLEHSVRAATDHAFIRIQKIARMNYREFERNPELVNEFVTLCSNNLTFVDTWEDPRILPSTMRLYSKKIPAREASRQFVASVRRSVNNNEYIEQKAEDIEKLMYSHQDWTTASETTSTLLEQKVKEPKTILFFRGAIFEMTFNKEGHFSNTQTAILYDLPNREDLSNWKKIKVFN